MAKTARDRYYVDSVTDLDDEKLHCRAYGHRWEQGPVNRLSPVGREVWTVHLRCACGKERRDYVVPGTFELEDRWYNRPNGFGVIEPADRHDFREEAIRRQRDRQKDQDVPFETVVKWVQESSQRAAGKRKANAVGGTNVVAFVPPQAAGH
jgi:cold shock CspA family protein